MCMRLQVIPGRPAATHQQANLPDYSQASPSAQHRAPQLDVHVTKLAGSPKPPSQP